MNFASFVMPKGLRTATMILKVAVRRPSGIKKEPKFTKKVPKATPRIPKGTQREAKRAQGAPKGRNKSYRCI